MTATAKSRRSRSPLVKVSAAESRNGKKRNGEHGTPPLWKIIQPKVRDRWIGLMRRDYDPASVRQVLDGTNTQRLYNLFQLFSLMEDSWPRLAKNLHEVKTAASKVPFVVTPYAEKGKKPTAKAIEKSNFMERAMTEMRGEVTTGLQGWRGMLFDLLDAYGKGLSVLEIMWRKRDSGEWIPDGTQWLRPIHFDYPPGYENEVERLLLCPDGMMTTYEEFPKDKFIIGVYRSRSSALATESSMLRALAPWWVFNNFATDWMLNFAQLFGIPIRWAEYDPRNADQLTKIEEMLTNMGSAAWGAFPEGTKLEFKEASSRGTDNPQNYILERADTLADLVILGQTLTSDVAKNGGNRALGEVHERVKGDRVVDAGEWLCEVLNTQFIPSLIRLNFGNEEELPTLGMEKDGNADMVALANRDKVLIKELGMEVPKEWLYDRHKIPMPGPGDEVFKVEQQPLPGQLGPDGRPLPGAEDEEPVEEDSKSFAAKFAFINASAHLGDVRLTDLHEATLADVRKFVDVSPRSKLRAQIYGMTVPELLDKADQHNLETARERVKRKHTPTESAADVRGKQDVKHVLLLNDRIIDGHHYLASAEHGKVTSSLRVLDLTPTRFQAKVADGEVSGQVVSALVRMPEPMRRHYVGKLAAA